jgi:hypothetical protein
VSTEPGTVQIGFPASTGSPQPAPDFAGLPGPASNVRRCTSTSPTS